MVLTIRTFTLGPLENNTYLVLDEETRTAAVIDPSFGSTSLLSEVAGRGYRLEQIWITHAHFDHIAGVQELVDGLESPPVLALHPADGPLWEQGGGSRMFGVNLYVRAQPNLFLQAGQILTLGAQRVEVRHTPGHTPGHVVFYSNEDQVVFCGDLIFRGSIGRTDLPDSDIDDLMESIRSQILMLPPDTRLLSGHGAESTVGYEKLTNPFLTF